MTSFRLGAVTTELVIPRIFEATGNVIYPFLSGVIVQAFAVVSAILFSMIDKYNEEQIKKEKDEVSAINKSISVKMIRFNITLDNRQSVTEVGN